MVLPRHSFSKNFWALFRGPWCSRPPFSNSPPRATYPRIFSRLSTPIYACGEAVEPNLQRHPYAKMVRHVKGWPTCGPYTLQAPYPLHSPQLHLHRLPFTINKWSLTSNVTPTPLPPCPHKLKRLTEADHILLPHRWQRVVHNAGDYSEGQ